MFEGAALICLACYGDRLAAVCDNADAYTLFDIRDHIYPAGLLSLPSKDPMDRTSAILACGVSFFLCGAVETRVREAMERGGVTVLPWLTGDAEAVAAAFFNQDFTGMTMPGAPHLLSGPSAAA